MADLWKVMSEHCREQHPLLCDDAPEEDLYNPQFYRRIRPKNYKGRVKNNLKGAAAVLTRWPDHWSSFLTYLWMGIGMISLSTFIIYNSLFAFSLLPSVNLTPIKENVIPIKSSLLPVVNMHKFVSQKEEVNIDQYVPYLEIIASTFLDYKFNFIIVTNDTNVGWISAEENNELALNTLFKKDKGSILKETRNNNINIVHLTLSALLDSSPLSKYWRILPHQLIEFLVRTVSIWDKGGVAFNPDILTTKFQHTLYIEKLQKLLNEYAHTNNTINISKTVMTLNKPQKKHRRLNNIRDIIDALKTENMSTNAFSENNLAEAENKVIKILQFDNYKNSVTETSDNSSEMESLNENIRNIISSTASVPIQTAKNNRSSFSNNMEPIDSVGISNNITKMSILPLLFEFFFHNNDDIKAKPSEISDRAHKSVIKDPNSEETEFDTNFKPTDEIETSYKSVKVRTPDIYSDSDNICDNTLRNKQSKEDSDSNRLTIDLKGNIIGTATPCHAFIGTIFTNVIHHSDEETITDFIVAELTNFCKGLLSTCTGIDLILL